MTENARRAAGAKPGLLEALLNPRCYPHQVAAVRLIETHISWVLLTGTYAYKIKKPVDLGFLDFSTLDARRFFCHQELLLNRRLAPEIYLDVVTIHGTPEAPRIGGDGPPLEYAVRMREFSQRARADSMLARGEFGAREVDALASGIAAFHATAGVADPATPFGAPGTILKPAMQNFEQIAPWLAHDSDRATLHELREWTVRRHAALAETFTGRKRLGFVRECHGDLHLGNIAVIDGRPTAFDCIEFSPELRWIDIMSEAAFLMMDLEDRGHRELAWRFLNGYLECSGDYAGLAGLDFYLVYRALVRAKVHALRSRQADGEEALRLWRSFREYLELAGGFTRLRRPALMIAFGVSASGKSTATQRLIERVGAVRVRSDVERKRLHGLAPHAASTSGVGSGIYSSQATHATYERLAELAGGIISAGHPAVVDAAFLKRGERERFRLLARRLNAPFLVLECTAPEPTLRSRIVQRQRAGNDVSEADLAVLEHQLTAIEPLAPEERAGAVTIGHDFPPPVSLITQRLGFGEYAPARVPKSGNPGVTRN